MQLISTVENLELLGKVFKVETDQQEREIKLLKGIPCGSSTTTVDQYGQIGRNNWIK